jgi:serine/threonine-protein kinase
LNEGTRSELRLSAEPQPEAVRQQLQRMLSSVVFINSVRLSKFLRYGVEAVLAGKTNLNEYAIGMDVFERGASFDPRVDPIVRVHARRLRSKLARYYAIEGAGDPIDIYLPLRSYIPGIRTREPRPAAQYAGLQQDARVLGAIAVFPFADLSPDGAEDYFAEGLTKEVIHSLSKVRNWRIVSWTGKEKRPDVYEIGRELGAQAALSGTVRRAGTMFRISAELISIPDRTVLWSNMYEVELESIITTQEKIAGAIGEALSLRLDRTASASHSPATLAYQLYLKGRYGCNKRDREGLAKCVLNLQQSIAADPQYAQSHSALAEAYVLMAFYAEAPPEEVLPQARREARQALKYDPSVADAHTVLGLVAAVYEWDLRRAESEFLRAIELAPNSALAPQWYAAACLTPAGRLEDALVNLRRAQELDPLMPTIPHHLAYVHCVQGCPEAALDQLYECLDLEPGFALTHWSIGLAFLGKHEYGRAVEEFETASRLSSGLSYAESALAHSCALAGDDKRARAILQSLLNRRSYVPRMDAALVHVGLGEYEDAFKDLETARIQRCAWLLRANTDPRLCPIRTDPRFRSLMKSLRLGFLAA